MPFSVEKVYRYHPGGLHPVHLGDRLNSDRYKIVHKLGSGATSTVWLARDCLLHRYVAMKIKESDLSKLLNELNILKHLSTVKSDHPGRSYSAAGRLLRHFWIVGPNGRHLVLVLHVLGPSIQRLREWKIRLHSCLVRSIALQATQGLEYLHSEGVCHGDFTSSDVLFQLTNFDSWSEYKLQKRLGSPRMFNIVQLPGRPRYLVDSASFFDAEPGLLTKNITIVDHSESFFIEFPPPRGLYTNYYAAPEVLFGCDANIHSDIWGLGCLIYEIRAGYLLFSPGMNNRPFEAVAEIVDMLGKVPSPWNHLQFNKAGYLERDCKNPIVADGELILYPLQDEVSNIEDKQISLPDANIGLEGSKSPKEAWKNIGLEGFKSPKEAWKKPSSSDVNGSKIRPHIQDGRSLIWKLFQSTRTDIVLLECSSSQILVQAAMKKDMAPLRKISAEESTSLTDLLSKILRYKPEDRISLSNIAKHPWLATLVDSTQKASFI